MIEKQTFPNWTEEGVNMRIGQGSGLSTMVDLVSLRDF